MADGVAGAHSDLRSLGDDGGSIGRAGDSDGADGVSSGGAGRRRSGRRAGRVAAAVGGGGGARGSDAGALGALGDAELGRVLVLAGHVVDELEAVVGGVGLEARGRSPGECAAVGDASHDGGDGDHVGGRAAEENKRDAVGGGWLPGDLEWLAGGDDLVAVSALVTFRVARLIPPVLSQQQQGIARIEGQVHTSRRGRVMGLPLGSPTGACWAAARPAKRATMAV